MCKQGEFRDQQYVEARILVAEREAQEQLAHWRGKASSQAVAESPEKSNYLSRKQVAQRLSVSVATVDRYRTEGVLTAVKQLLPTIRFREAEVDLLRKKRKP